MQGRVSRKVVMAIAILGMLGISGCGVRGALDAPPEAKAEAGANAGAPGSPPPHKPSILDPLIR
jgi:predicted small lipoprotein YifL